MTLTASELVVKSAGDLFLAPAATAAPAVADLTDDAALETAGWIHAGWIGEDGPEFSGFEGENTKHYGWNRVAPARSTTRKTEPMIEVPLLQWNVENLTLYFPGSTHDDVTSTLTIPEAGNPTAQAMLVRVLDGNDALGVWASRAEARGGDGLEFPGDGLAEIPVAWDILGGDTPWVQVVGVDVAAA